MRPYAVAEKYCSLERQQDLSIIARARKHLNYFSAEILPVYEALLWNNEVSIYSDRITFNVSLHE